MEKEVETKRMTASFEEVAYSNMIVVEALVELFIEKELLSRAEIDERIRDLKKKVTVNFARGQ